MPTTPKRILLLMVCSLLCLLAACSTPSLVHGQALTASLLATGQSKNAQITTTPVPPTQTSCPTPGTARAMVSAPLALGRHPNIVYIVTEYKGNKVTFSTLKRYDVASGRKTEILKQANVFLDSAQLSADGQWILFVTGVPGNNGTLFKLQMIRMDGQGLQTLSCGAFQNPQWSTDQKSIVFNTFRQNGQTIYLLDVAKGKVQPELNFTSNGGGGFQGYNIRTWLDNRHVYLTGVNIDQPASGIFLLDITKGANQTERDLITVSSSRTNIGDLDSSYDAKQLFVDHGGCGQGGCLPPSNITVQPAMGGTEHVVFSSNLYDVVSVRAVTLKKLLIVIENNSPINGGPDISHNGLWSLNTDGGGLKRLTTDSQHSVSSLAAYSQFPWSNVSRDGSIYVVEQNNFQRSPSTYSLSFGSLNGGPLTTFASIADGTTLSTVGWTTL